MKSFAGCLMSESGRFYMDEAGVVQRFEAAAHNPVTEEERGDARFWSPKTTACAVDTLIVPCGVKGFCREFMRHVRVRKRFELPDGLVSIGSLCAPDAPYAGCVFSHSELPSVCIPESVNVIGDYAFGHSLIGVLQLPLLRHCPYSRQFKDSRASVLRLPNVLRDFVRLVGDHLCIHRALPGAEARTGFGCLRSLCSNARIGGLEFY